MSRTARPGRPRPIRISGRTVMTRGLRRNPWADLYHSFMTVPWSVLIATLAAGFTGFNLLFALAYALDPGGIANLNPPGFWGCFFFSIETLATVGYGDMHPQSVFAHVLSSTEIFLGLLCIALMTGAMFARFSRPRARFLFARKGVVRPLDGRTTLMFRAANARQNIIMEASAQLRLMRDVTTPEGYRIRRIEDLPLLRSEHPIFLLGWNLMHVIDEASPLRGEDGASLAKSRAVFLLTLSGTDDTTGQVLMARAEFHADAVHWNHAFRDVLRTGADGVDHLDYEHFHTVDPLPAEPGAGRPAGAGMAAGGLPAVQ
jgi:inward rectifier potassium channel